MKKRFALLSLVLFTLTVESSAMIADFQSSTFKANTTIPSEYTCQGADKSPPLSWKNDSDKTQSYVLIVDDPDAPAGVWDHWILFNIPKDVTQIEEGQTPKGASTAKNSWGKTNWGGPCPPSGTHRYFFKLFALDTLLNFPATPNKQELMTAMEGHVDGKSEFIGLYAKK